MASCIGKVRPTMHAWLPSFDQLSMRVIWPCALHALQSVLSSMHDQTVHAPVLHVPPPTMLSHVRQVKRRTLHPRRSPRCGSTDGTPSRPRPSRPPPSRCRGAEEEHHPDKQLLQLLQLLVLQPRGDCSRMSVRCRQHCRSQGLDVLLVGPLQSLGHLATDQRNHSSATDAAFRSVSLQNGRSGFGA